jgi:putative transposase
MIGYSKFFNALRKRKGPLCESRFKSKHIDSNDYFLHLTRYVNLNPVKAKLVASAEDWEFSSYRQYIGAENADTLCDFKSLIPYSPGEYRRFSENHLDYQKNLAKISHLLIDSETQV